MWGVAKIFTSSHSKGGGMRHAKVYILSDIDEQLGWIQKD